MNLEQKAERLGINSSGLDETELIRAVQSKEGFSPCFGHGLFTCNHLECCWRDKCLRICADTVFEIVG